MQNIKIFGLFSEQDKETNQELEKVLNSIRALESNIKIEFEQYRNKVKYENRRSWKHKK